MKSLLSIIFTLAVLSVFAQSKTLDTLIDIGGYKMHFNVWKGNGVPILFLAGSGNDGSVWNSILEPIHSATGAPIITFI